MLNAKFDCPNAASGESQEGESDVLVLIPPYLLIANCKGHRFSKEARRGAPSLGEDIRRIIGRAAEQSEHLVLELRKQKTLTVHSSAGITSINSEDYIQAIPLTVVLDSMCPLLSNMPMLTKAHLVGPEAPVAMVTTVTDLECVVEILPTESQRLHYLVMRDIIECEGAFFSDELGLLRIYLDNSLLKPLPEIFRELPLIEIYGNGFNPYFMQQWTGKSVEIPKQRLTPWIATLLQILENEKPLHWREIGQTLLHLGPGCLAHVEKRVREIKSAINQNSNSKPINVVPVGLDNRSVVLLFFVYPLKADLTRIMETLGQNKKTELGVSLAVVFWINCNAADCRIWSIGVY